MDIFDLKGVDLGGLGCGIPVGFGCDFRSGFLCFLFFAVFS